MRELCKGFSVWDVTGEYLKERVFAKLPDGRIYATDWRRKTNDFDRLGEVWKRVDAMPFNREFIGNYPFPMILQD